MTSEGLTGFIERHEGFSSTVYHGTDYWNSTIGYGHLVENGESFVQPMTAAEADKLLRQDLIKYENSVNKEFKGTPLAQWQHDALVDFSYNLGAYIWPKAKKLVKDVKSGASDDTLLIDFTAFDTVKGEFCRGLYKRRCDEWRLYCNGDYGT